MSNSPRSSSSIALALFSVCADRELVAAALDVTSELPGAVFVGEFHDYITADKRPQFESSVNEASACVALVDFDRNPDLALKTTERLRHILPNRVNVIALASELNAELLLKAMRAGCIEYLTKPVDRGTLNVSLGRLQSSPEVALAVPRKRGQIATLSGAKGGVGTTALAVHLATHIASLGKRTLLVDYHHELGDVGLYLGMKESEYCFDDVVRNAERLDTDLLKGFVTHRNGGLHVIASSDTGAARQQWTSDAVGRAMAFFRREYEWVVIDSSLASANDEISLLEQTDHAYLVTTTDIASLRNMRRRVDRMSLTDANRAKASLVLNRVTDSDAVTPDQIRESIGLPIAASLPNTYAEMLQALNKGEPLDPHGKAAFSKRMATWARNLAGISMEVSTAKAKGKHLTFWRK
jgi:pilus assembly protein CpaE